MAGEWEKARQFSSWPLFEFTNCNNYCFLKARQIERSKKEQPVMWPCSGSHQIVKRETFEDKEMMES